MTAQAAPLREAAGYIDAHVHVWTPDIAAYPLHEHTVKAMRPPSFTPEELFEQCRPAGVERVVLIQMSFYRYDNSYMLDTLERYPGVFSAVGIIDPFELQVPERVRELARRGVRGFRISPDHQPGGPMRAVQGNVGDWLRSAGMAAMWRAADDYNLAICPLINPEVLPELDLMCTRYPRTKVVIDHFARIGMAGPPREEDLDNLCRLARFEHVHVKTSAFYALGAKKSPYTDLAPMVRRLRDAFGAQRLMWASDCPFQVQDGHTYADSIALVRDHLDFLSADERDWLLRKTADRVFFS